MRFLLLSAVTLPLVFSAASAQPYSSVYFQGTSPVLNQDGTLEFDGVRAVGSGLTLNDALDFKYAFNLRTLGYDLTSKTLFKNVGVFNGSLMAINVSPKQPVAHIGVRSYRAGTSYQFTASQAAPFVWTYQLVPGDVLSWNIILPSGEYRMTFAGPGTNYSQISPAGRSGVSGAYPILTAGTYTLTIAPTDSSRGFYFTIRGWNANNRTLPILKNGSYINVSFASDVRDYAKYAVPLKKGQVLRLPLSASDIALVLLDDLGAVVYDAYGSGVAYQAPADGTYYLFIFNQNGWGGYYLGTASITDEPLSSAPSGSAAALPLRVTPARVNAGGR